MGVGLIRDEHGNAAFYDSGSGFAFGPIFEDWDDPDEFLSWLRKDGSRLAMEEGRMPLLGSDGDDPREWGEGDLVQLIIKWRTLRDNDASD